MNRPRFLLRYQGREYGPFTEEKIRAWIADRPIAPGDLVIDRESGAETPLAAWNVKPASAPDFWDTVTVPSTYRRITVAGIVLVVLWALVFTGMRLVTGKWPGQGAPPHHNPVLRIADTDTVSPP